MNKRLATITGIILFIFAIWQLADRGFLRMNYLSHSDFPILGIDVSHHQGEIDWTKVRKDHIRFAYIKATEGGDFKDPKFLQNWREAKTAGLRVGAYHFFTLCRPVEDQIANFLTTISFEDDSLPPALDLEFLGNCKDSIQKVTLPSDIEIFINAIKQKFGKDPVLYTTYEFYDAHLRSSSLKLNNVWIRSIFGFPDEDPKWILWQYANRGRIKGIDTPVDLNAYRGTFEDFYLF
ncbi:MAG: GH25 family lysozyme [Proteobacteria bacterium]|nr:GH25 family lysozyme [Pseudomonadota bacterium]